MPAIYKGYTERQIVFPPLGSKVTFTVLMVVLFFLPFCCVRYHTLKHNSPSLPVPCRGKKSCLLDESASALNSLRNSVANSSWTRHQNPELMIKPLGCIFVALTERGLLQQLTRKGEQVFLEERATPPSVPPTEII